MAEMKLVVKQWKFMRDDKNQTKIAGSYDITCNGKVMATQSFNDGYGSSEIGLPTELVCELEAFDRKVKDALIKHFAE